MTDREREMDATSTLTAGQRVRVRIALHPEKYPVGTIATVDGTCPLTRGVRISLSGGETTTIFRGLVRPV